MGRGKMSKALLALGLVILLSGTAPAAEMSISNTSAIRTKHRVVRFSKVLPEHVVEVSIHPPGQRYIINGAYWTGTSPACFGWAPKQRVSMIAGEWHGYCSTAIIRNVTLGRTCEFVCG